jgi:hypothetical protein
MMRKVDLSGFLLFHSTASPLLAYNWLRFSGCFDSIDLAQRRGFLFLTFVPYRSVYTHARFADMTVAKDYSVSATALDSRLCATGSIPTPSLRHILPAMVVFLWNDADV